jgi:hypothetical protein
MALDFALYSPDVGERQMLFEHLESLRPLVSGGLGSLDRIFPG